MSERDRASDLVVVGASRSDFLQLRDSLPELSELEVSEVSLSDAPSADSERVGAAVVFDSAAGRESIERWLRALPPRATLFVAEDAQATEVAAPDGVEVLRPDRRERLVPTVARMVRRARPTGLSPLPSRSFCGRLLETADPEDLCRILAGEIAETTSPSWVAVLQVSGEARAFDVAGSVGSLPSVLHDCHDMTPAELAGALGWNARRPSAQLVKDDQSTVSRALTRDGTAVAFAILQGPHTVHGMAIAGWTPPARPHPSVIAALTALAETGAAALRHAVVVADLRISERTKSEFVATMSHELRNPLSAILGYTDLLVHGDFGALGDEQAEVLRRAHHSASSLLDLINATLDVSRFEVGENTEQSSRIDLYEILVEEVDELGRGRRRAQVRILRDNEETSAVVGDPLKVRVTLRQALEAAIGANRGDPMRLELRRHQAGCAIELASETDTERALRTPVIVELPEDAEAQGVPFAVFVTKRLLELIGATLAVWREPSGNHISFRLWIPDQRPAGDRLPAV